MSATYLLSSEARVALAIASEASFVCMVPDGKSGYFNKSESVYWISRRNARELISLGLMTVHGGLTDEGRSHGQSIAHGLRAETSVLRALRSGRPQSDRGSVDTAYLWLGSTAVGCGCLMLLAPVFAWIVGVPIVAMVVAAVVCAIGGGARR